MRFRTRLCLIALAGILLSGGCFLYGRWGQKPLQELKRPGAGEGSREETLMLELEGKYYPFEVLLREVSRTEQESREMLQKASEELEKLFLKDNKDLCHIVTDVDMPSSYPQSDISIQWHMNSWEYVEPDGTVRNEKLEAPVSGEIQAVLVLGDESLTWEREIQICPIQEPDVEQKIRILEYQLQELQEGSQEEWLYLPAHIGGDVLCWYEEPDNRWIWMLMLTITALCASAVGYRKDMEKEEKKRERCMELDYAEIVNRLSLYMGAGMSTRKAWERIVENYEKEYEEEQRSRFAYNEMRTTLHEMQSGISEAAAYERFGTRCRMPAYLKLGTLLAQNLRRGTGNLAALLQEEAREAFEDRKALAKRMGEECESRLLLPMIMMLVTVLIIVMYPALVSFQV